MLSLQNISYKIGNKFLLEQVTLNFEPGKLHLIIGPNGAGKSTLIKVICKQIQPQQGAVQYANRNIREYSDLALGQIRAVLSQNIELAFPLKVWEVVMMGRYPHFTVKPTAKDEQACEEAMRFFDVWDMANRNYMTLSGGEKQRVHFARVTAQIWYPTPNNARYLIMDEPLTFLDIHYQFHFMHKLLLLLKDANLVVVGVVHDLNLAAKFADNLVLLYEGKILAQGTSKQVLTEQNIQTAYQLKPVVVENEAKNTLFLYFE